MKKQLIVTGNTYQFRESFKRDGFRWNPNCKAWAKTFEAEDKMLKTLTEAYAENGLHTEVKTLADKQEVEKRYRVKQSWIFNLESMHDKIFCLSYDIEEGKIILPFEVAGKTINEVSDLFDLLDEADALRDKAWSDRGVTGKEYGRISEIVAWRVNARYNACMASGMVESEAGKCFEDM